MIAAAQRSLPAFLRGLRPSPAAGARRPPHAPRGSLAHIRPGLGQPAAFPVSLKGFGPALDRAAAPGR